MIRYKKSAGRKSYGITKPNGVSAFSSAFKCCAYLSYTIIQSYKYDQAIESLLVSLFFFVGYMSLASTILFCGSSVAGDTTRPRRQSGTSYGGAVNHPWKVY